MCTSCSVKAILKVDGPDHGMGSVRGKELHSKHNPWGSPIVCGLSLGFVYFSE